LLVSVPFWTSEAIKLSIFDFISDGDGGDDEEDEEASLCNALLMLVSAVLSALSSDELIVPSDTSDVSSFSSMSKGDWG
jgi:hypothetical protein